MPAQPFPWTCSGNMNINGPLLDFQMPSGDKEAPLPSEAERGVGKLSYEQETTGRANMVLPTIFETCQFLAL